MALSLGLTQNALHRCSKNAMNLVTWNRPSPMVDSQAPRFRTAATKAEEPVIPPSSAFQGLQEAAENPDLARLPTTAECAVHLELLEAFYYLRRRVLQSRELDTVLGIKPQPRIVWRGRGRYKKQIKLKDDTFAERRKDKWPFFVAVAVGRFKRWLVRTELDLGLGETGERVAKVKHLPPLDVLMVWHSFLLNPHWFQRHCEENRLGKILNAMFPWAKIHQAIKRSDWSFALNESDAVHFRVSTDCASDLLAYLIDATKTFTLLNLLVRQGGRTRPIEPLDIRQAMRTRAILPQEDMAFMECWMGGISGETTAVDLVNAVQRQVSFVEKMEKHLWIRSPALEGTLERAVDRYSKFLKLFKLYPQTLLVPTLDIDLVWHTHQCSPSHYRAATQLRTGRFIDHDDKLGTAALDEGMKETKGLFRIRFGQEYLVCHCWDCEAALSAVSAGGMDSAIDAEALAKEIAEDVAYHRAVELARRAGNPLPVRYS